MQPGLRTEKKSLIDTARRNLEQNNIVSIEPNRVVYGYTPRGLACVDETADTIFLGEELLKDQDSKDVLIDIEHELIHYRQFHSIFGEPPEIYHDKRQKLEERALNRALRLFDHDSYTAQFASNGNVHWGNFPLMLALASGHEEFIEPLEKMYQGREMTVERFEDRYHKLESEIVPEGVSNLLEVRETLTPEQTAELAKAREDFLSAGMKRESEFVDDAEAYIQDHWQELLNSKATDFAEPLIERYTPKNDFRDDILEAQAQFWSYFRRQALEDIEEHPQGVYPQPLEEALASTEIAYQREDWYQNAEGIRPELENRIEKYRELVTDGAEPYNAASKVVKTDFELLRG